MDYFHRMEAAFYALDEKMISMAVLWLEAQAKSFPRKKMPPLRLVVGQVIKNRLRNDFGEIPK